MPKAVQDNKRACACVTCPQLSHLHSVTLPQCFLALDERVDVTIQGEGMPVLTGLGTGRALGTRLGTLLKSAQSLALAYARNTCRRTAL